MAEVDEEELVALEASGAPSNNANSILYTPVTNIEEVPRVPEGYLQTVLGSMSAIKIVVFVVVAVLALVAVSVRLPLSSDDNFVSMFIHCDELWFIYKDALASAFHTLRIKCHKNLIACGRCFACSKPYLIIIRNIDNSFV